MKSHPARALRRALVDSCRRCGLPLAVTGLAVAAPAHAGDVFVSWPTPPIAIAEAERPQGPSVLGTVALPIRTLSTSTRWTKLMLASLDQPGLRQFVARAQALAPHEQVAFVQMAVNHAVSTTASDDCSDQGYWRPAQETLALGRGNCFDVAIAKMEALRMLGLRGADLYLTTGYIRNEFGFAGRRRESVALLVRIDKTFWLLTEHSDSPIEAAGATSESSGFTPMLTYGVGMTWVHGRLVKTDPPDQGNGPDVTFAAAP